MQISRQLMAFAKQVPKHLETLKVWVDELLESLRVLFGGLPKQLTDFFTKFDISLQKVPQQALYSGIPVKVSDDLYALIKDGKELFRGTKAEIEALAKKLDELSNDAARKYLEELAESRKLDDFINSQNFKFRALGYRFTHTIRKAKDGVLEVDHFLINEKGEKFLQGFSTISKEGILFNVFDVKIKKVDVSTAMYKLLDKIGFKKVKSSYGSGTLGDNFEQFMKTYNKNKDNKVEAAMSTPAGKALNKALDNRFIPVDIIVTINKIKLYWIKK